MGMTKKVSTKKRGPKPSLHPMKNPRDYHEGEVPYSTSYQDPATTSCYIAPYKPETIHRDHLGTAERGVGQYRSVNWGKDGCYADYRDIDVLDQPAAYEKPSWTTTLISPDAIYNSVDNVQYHGHYGGYGGTMTRSEGIDYSKRVYKRTACNGLRKDTLSREYIHTDEPSVCTTQYVEPKPYQCFEGPKDYRKVKGANGAVKVGYDDPLEYPSYHSKTYHYEKPVIQNYDVTKTCKKDPYYVPYEGPHYNFYEYEPKEPVKILPTYYEAPTVKGEKSYGYIPEPKYVDIKEYPVGKGYYDDYDAKPMKVVPRYPTETVQTYNAQVIEKTKLQPSKFKAATVHHDLVPAYEKAVYEKPKYGPPRKDYPEVGHDIIEKPYQPKMKHYQPKKQYGGKEIAIDTDYYPTVTKVPKDYLLGCKTCKYY